MIIYKRHIYGVVGWFILTVLLSAVVTETVMILREVYQYHKYLKPYKIGFEWDDVIRYTICIVVGQVVQIMVLGMLL